MKKILLAAVLFTAVSPLAFSGTVPVANTSISADPIDGVPSPVQKSFNGMFPTATNVKWKAVTTTATVIYVASFYQITPAGVQHYRAFYAADGTFLGKQLV